jgi:lysophospholipase
MVSDIAELSNFKNHEMPFPMWQSPMSTPNDVEFYHLKVPFYNATIYEWSPLEIGAWSSGEWSGPGAFFPIKYLGTKMADGKPVDDCVVGFDRATYMLGVAADAVNFWLIEAYSNGTLGNFAKRSVDSSLERRETADLLVEAVESLQKLFTKYFNYTLTEDVYTTMPNPFALSSSTTNDDKPPANLTLLDGSEAGQSLPLWTQIQPARNPEFVIAWDGDQDAQPYAWSNGSNMYNSYIYATNHSIPFPIVPPVTTFINRNYTFKPTFFGCDAELTNTNDTSGPIVLYLPNAPYSSYTNFTWYQDTFTDEQMAVILTNGFNYVTQGNSTLDQEWPECLGCAAIDRSLSKLGIERTEQCQRCMKKYCWDGVEDNSETGPVDIPLVLDPSWTYAEWNKSTPMTGLFWGETPERDSGS